MNPYTLTPPRISQGLKDWQALLPEPISTEHPLRIARLLLAVAMLSPGDAFAGSDADFLRECALIRRVNCQQRLQLLSLLPREQPCERMLLLLFMLTELTAAAAQRTAPPRAHAVMDFLLPEDCDMLYRTANFLSLEYGVSANDKLHGMAELMPGRPCIAAQRHPYDEVQAPLEQSACDTQCTLFLYMLGCAARYGAALAEDALGESREKARALYAEFSLILSGHAAQYFGLLGQAPDSETALISRAYTLCYAFYGLHMQEDDPALRDVYAQAFHAQCAHLHKARRLYLRAHDGQEPPAYHQQLPPPLILCANKGYIRGALRSVGVTLRRGQHLPVGTLPDGADFFRYQQRVSPNDSCVPSHAIVNEHIRRTGQDFRIELAPHPVELLRSRTIDQVCVGR